MGFDEHALHYEDALTRGVRLSGESPTWFAEQRVRIVRDHVRRLGLTPGRVVEFGCGVGNHVPFFMDAFPGCEVIGLDISDASLRVAEQTHTRTNARFMRPAAFDQDGSVDLIYINGVFHHIDASDHITELQRMARWLRPGGLLAFFDNNPFSLPARVVMKLIPFDRDAVMVNPYRVSGLLGACGLEMTGREFHFVFPRRLALLRRLERRIKRWPFGAQYLLLARKKSVAP